MWNHKSELHPMAFTDLTYYTVHIQTRQNSNGKCTLWALLDNNFFCGVGLKPNTKIYRKTHLQNDNDHTMQYNSNHVRQPVVQLCNRHRLVRRRLAYCCWKRKIDASNIKFGFFFHSPIEYWNYFTLKSNEQFAQKFHHVRWDVRLHRRLIWVNIVAPIYHGHRRKFRMHHKSIDVSNLYSKFHFLRISGVDGVSLVRKIAINTLYSGWECIVLGNYKPYLTCANLQDRVFQRASKNPKQSKDKFWNGQKLNTLASCKMKKMSWNLWNSTIGK